MKLDFNFNEFYTKMFENNSSTEWFNTTVETYLDEKNSSCPEDNLSSNDDDPEDDNDSLMSEDVLADDLEKTNAVVAAFTVVIIFTLFFIEVGFTLIFMIIITHEGQQNMLIAHGEIIDKVVDNSTDSKLGLCSQFPQWKMIENSTNSNCDPKIFNQEFSLEVQCPCFLNESKRDQQV